MISLLDEAVRVPRSTALDRHYDVAGGQGNETVTYTSGQEAATLMTSSRLKASESG
jgi:hypothetical protein